MTLFVIITFPMQSVTIILALLAERLLSMTLFVMSLLLRGFLTVGTKSEGQRRQRPYETDNNIIIALKGRKKIIARFSTQCPFFL
jgi:hypothetical protein